MFLGYTGEIVERFVSGLLDLVATMAILYLGAGVIDRSQVLSKIGDGFRTRYSDEGVYRVKEEMSEPKRRREDDEDLRG